VDATAPQEISCNLPRAAEESSAAVVFASAGQPLPAGHVLHVALGRLPVPLMAYARPLAALILGGLIAGTSLVMFRRRRRAPRQNVSGTVIGIFLPRPRWENGS
jgi:hypothetical protein